MPRCFSFAGRSDGEYMHSKRIKVGELDIHYLTGGYGDPLIVIHGGANGAGAWKENLAELSKYYTVYVPDLPGFGRSQPIDGDCHIPELVEFVDDFSDELRLEKFHLVGHSLGGGIALSYVLKFPHKIKKLVLISSMFLGREVALWTRFLSNCVVSRAIGAAVVGILKGVKWVAERLFAGVEFMLPFSKVSMGVGTSIITLKEQAIVLMHRLSEVVVPTLVVWGAKDPIVPVEHAYAAAELIPDCQVKVFEGCGHSVYRERIPEFSQLITGFLG